MSGLILIYITNPSEEKAKEIAKHLIEKKLIACGNILASSSLYKWKGNLEDEKEFVLLAKTTEEKFDKVKEEVKKIHPYDIPCIVKIPVNSNEKYFEWVKGEIK